MLGDGRFLLDFSDQKHRRLFEQPRNEATDILPLAPAVMVIQVALLLALQLHPVAVVTLTLPVPPVEATDALAAEIE